MAKSLFAAVLLLLPCLASAHERQAFRIGDQSYVIVIGMVNEPVFTGDKSGAELRVRLADPKDPTDPSLPAVKPVEHLEKSLQVEVAAGGRKQVFDFEPAFRDPGLYRATFFPTAATAYNFRVFGELNGTPVDLTFPCNPGGEQRPGEDRSAVKLSDGVTRIYRSGAFACPKERKTVEFPGKPVR